MSKAELAVAAVQTIRLFLEPVDWTWVHGATDERLQDPRLRKMTAENFWRIEYIIREHRVILADLGFDGGGNSPEPWAMHDKAKARLIGLGIDLRDPYSERFPDVSEGHWADGAIHNLRRAGVLYGYPDGEFKPG